MNEDKPIKKWSSIDFRNAREEAMEALADPKDSIRMVFEPMMEGYSKERARIKKDIECFESYAPLQEEGLVRPMESELDERTPPPRFYKVKVAARVYDGKKRKFSIVRYRSGIISRQQMEAFTGLEWFMVDRGFVDVRYRPYDQLEIQMSREAALALKGASPKDYRNVFQEHLERRQIRMVLLNTRTGKERPYRNIIELSKSAGKPKKQTVV